MLADHKTSTRSYNIIRNDRNRNGGGVATYIRSMINYKENYDLEDDNLEKVTVDKISKPRSEEFNTWYWPPDTRSTVFTNFEECIKRWTWRVKKLYL